MGACREGHVRGVFQLVAQAFLIPGLEFSGTILSKKLDGPTKNGKIGEVTRKRVCSSQKVRSRPPRGFYRQKRCFLRFFAGILTPSWRSTYHGDVCRHENENSERKIPSNNNSQVVKERLLSDGSVLVEDGDNTNQHGHKLENEWEDCDSERLLVLPKHQGRVGGRIAGDTHSGL